MDGVAILKKSVYVTIATLAMEEDGVDG